MMEGAADRPLAAIDVGTNSVHMVVARAVRGARPEVLAREKMPVRLGSGRDDMKHLQPDAVGRAVAALDECRRIAEAHGAEVVAVATSAVREAENRDEVVARFLNESAVVVDVVSGAEEARLIHLGALSAVAVADRRHLVIDIGGGSTEFIVGEGTDPLLARSLKLGHIRLSERFFPGGRIEDGQIEGCRRFVTAFVAALTSEVRRLGFDVAVGCSGTIETLATMAAHRRGEPLATIASAVLTRDELDGIVVDITEVADPSDRRFDGLEANRRDVIVAGALLAQGLCRSFDVDELIVSPGALREGVLLDRFRRRDTSGHGLHHLEDLRRSSVLALAARCEEDIDHAEHATDLALELFDETVTLHGLGVLERDVLEAAGLLHNVGRFVAHASHHRHSYYLIRHSEHIAGFTDHELELMAQVARYHRKSAPRRRHPEFARLSDEDKRRVKVLAGMLRVGIALDRTYQRVVAGLRTRDDGRVLELEAEVPEGRDAELELFTAREHVGLLGDALDRTVTVDIVRSD